MSTFMERWNDPGLEIPEDWNADAYAIEQCERLTATVVMATQAHNIPRRLGADATPAEMSEEKKLCRAVITRSNTVYRMWNAGQSISHALPDEDEMHRQGAQIIWSEWWPERKAYLQQQLRLVATVCIRTGEFKIGNAYCNRLLNELNIFGQVFENLQHQTVTPEN